MQPRLKTSKKHTDFPLDYVKMIKDVIASNFKSASKGKDVIVVGNIYPDEICLRIGFREKGSIKQVNFDVSTDHSLKKKNIMDQIYLALDAVGSMISQYFDDEGDLELPGTWTEFKLEGQLVYLRSSTENQDLEKAADRLLGHTDDENDD